MADDSNKDDEPKKSCWECKYQQISGNTFLGICTWFEQSGKGTNKEIAAGIVDKGCKFFEVRQSPCQFGYCIVDEPKLKGLMPYNPTATTGLGYFRFHGRNTNWFDASVAERYDYLYTPEELRSFIPGIKNISSITGKTIVMFNNCHAGKSVKNAIEMLNLISQKRTHVNRYDCGTTWIYDVKL